MKIEKLEIRNFGKMQNRTLEFSDGIQLISGENESGKSTVHTFIRSMLFGMTRGRGRAAKNDVYSRYEPWENPAYYAALATCGLIWHSTNTLANSCRSWWAVKSASSTAL